MRWIRAFTTLALTLAVVVGPPLAAWWWLTTTGVQVPSGAQLTAGVADPMTTSTATVGIITLAAVLLWLVVVALIVASTWGRVRRVIGWWRRVPLPTPAQATATSMAGAAAFSVPATAMTSPAHQPPPAGIPPVTSTTTHPPTHTEVGEEQTAEGVDLPDGGWVPADTARAVAATAGTVWIRRRRLYQPGPVDTTPADDLQPLPRTVNILHTAVHTDDPDTRLSPPSSGPPHDLALLMRQFATRRLALTGPGASAAARGLLITTLLPAPDQDRPALLVTTRTDLADLLASTTLDAPDLPGLHIANDLDAALDHRPPTTPDTVDPWAIPPPAGTVSLPVPRALAARTLLVHTPTDPRLTHRLDTALATDPSLTVVLLGAPPTTGSCHVNGAGHLDTPHLAPRARYRVCVLTPRATADLLTLAGHTYPGEPETRSSRPATIGGEAGRNPAPAPREHAPRAGAGPTLRLQVLGPPQLLYAGVPVTVRRSAGWQILVLLALHRQGATAHELADALWPALHPHLVMQRLYTSISELRKTLHPLTGDPVIHHTAEHYHLHPDHIDVDLWHFHHAVDAAANALTATDRRHALTTMTSTYTGELAADQPWHWIHPHRETQRRHAINAHTELATTSTPTQAATLLQHATTIDPHNDNLHHRAAQAVSAMWPGPHQDRLYDFGGDGA